MTTVPGLLNRKLLCAFFIGRSRISKIPSNKALKYKHKRREEASALTESFFNIQSIQKSNAAKLDKLRKDLHDSIERTDRIQKAFVRQLADSNHSLRILHCIKHTEEIKFYTDCQRSILRDKLSNVLSYKG